MEKSGESLSVALQAALVQQLVPRQNNAEHVSTEFRALVEALKLNKVETNSEN
jgi:hypothetical protein